MAGMLLFCAGVVVSLAASWLLVSRLERLGERAGFSEAWLGLVAALAADDPEVTAAVTALSRGQASVGAGVVIGSNVFNLAALLGLAGLGPRSGPGTLVAAWYAGLIVLALALAFRGRGLGRLSGAAIIAGYLAFVTTLVITVEQGTVSPATAVVPAAVITAAGILLLTWPRRTVAAGPGGLWQRESVLPGWSIGRLWRFSLISCGVIAAGDAASGPHLIGLLVIGPVAALLTGRWTLTAAASGLAIALGVALGIPDQIFATITQYTFLAAVAAVGTTATAGAAVLQHQRPRLPPG